MNLSPKENLLRVLRHENPEYIPFDLSPSINVFHRDAKFYRQNGNPALKEWNDSWGVTFRMADISNPYSAYPVSHPLKSLDQIDSFPWPDPEDSAIMVDVKKIVQSMDRENSLTIGWNPGFLFVRSWLLFGMNELLMAMVLEKEKVTELFDKILRYQKVIVRRYIEAGVDIIHFGDDAGTTKALMFDPKLWREMIKPRLKIIIDICKDAGKFVYFHCCGRVMEIIDDILDLNVDILNPIQAGANDLEILRDKTQGKITLYGGIDSHTVMTATPEEVVDLTEKTVFLLGENGDYIAAPDQEFIYPEENIRSVERTVAKVGFYKDGRLSHFQKSIER